MRDMTMPEVLSDPLIRQLMRADRVSLHAFTTLLREAAERAEEQAERKVAIAGPHANISASPKSNAVMQEDAV